MSVDVLIATSHMMIPLPMASWLRRLTARVDPTTATPRVGTTSADTHIQSIYRLTLDKLVVVSR